MLKSDPDYRKGLFMRIESRMTGRVWCTASRLWEIENSNGDDPLLLKDYENFRRLNSETEDRRRFVLKPSPIKLLDLMSVKYVVSSECLTEFEGGVGLRLIDHGPPMIYLNPTFLPRAHLVTQVIVEHDLAATSRRLVSPDFSPRNAIVIDQVEAMKLPQGHEATAAAEISDDSAQILSHRPNEVVVSVDSPSDAILVLSETYFPGWIAEIDGIEKEIFRANGFQRAVKVKSGSHRVVFRYQPMPVRIGAMVSCATLLVVLVVCLATWEVGKIRETSATN